MTRIRRPAAPPPLFWRLTEGRAIFELGAFQVLRNRMRKLPKGDGHPVLFLPGFLASDSSTRPMRSLFEDLGYQTFGWELGRNIKFNAERAEAMAQRLAAVYDQTGEKVSIIGWSLGGTFARELAKGQPGKVRQVISLGSPISGDRRHASSRRLFELFNDTKALADEEDDLFSDLSAAPPVPTTSIFTRTDGVVSWRGSVQHPQIGHAEIDNIVVPASHIGLGVNPLVMLVIADRLALPEDGWEPFERSGWREFIFQTTPSDL